MFEPNHLPRFFTRLQFVSYLFLSVILFYIFRCVDRYVYRILTGCVLYNSANTVVCSILQRIGLRSMVYCWIDTIDFYCVFKKVLYIFAVWCSRCRRLWVWILRN